MKFALFFMAEYIKMIAVCDDRRHPLPGRLPAARSSDQRARSLGPVYLFVKVAVLLFVIDLGAGDPAAHPLRPADGVRLEDYCFPLALLNVLITAVVIWRID